MLCFSFSPWPESHHSAFWSVSWVAVFSSRTSSQYSIHSFLPVFICVPLRPQYKKHLFHQIWWSSCSPALPTISQPIASVLARWQSKSRTPPFHPTINQPPNLRTTRPIIHTQNPQIRHPAPPLLQPNPENPHQPFSFPSLAPGTNRAQTLRRTKHWSSRKTGTPPCHDGSLSHSASSLGMRLAAYIPYRLALVQRTMQRKMKIKGKTVCRL